MIGVDTVEDYEVSCACGHKRQWRHSCGFGARIQRMTVICGSLDGAGWRHD